MPQVINYDTDLPAHYTMSATFNFHDVSMNDQEQTALHVIWNGWGLPFDSHNPPDVLTSCPGFLHALNDQALAVLRPISERVSQSSKECCEPKTNRLSAIQPSYVACAAL